MASKSNHKAHSSGRSHAVDPEAGKYQTLAVLEESLETVNRGTSMPKLPSCNCPETRAYTLGEKLGPETRHHEFKNGFLHGAKLKQKSEFIPFVGRYMCAFLNSGGGVMFFGVDDDSVVTGVRVSDSDKKDFLKWIELIFTTEMKMVTGNIVDYEMDLAKLYGTLYSVTFSKVYAVRNKGTPKEKRELEENLNVIEICIHPRDDGEKYMFHDKTFSRRDASCRFPVDQNPHLKKKE